MNTEADRRPLRLTLRGYSDDDYDYVAADDCDGRVWAFTEPIDGCTDQDLPEWPPCVACGLGVDWVYKLYWRTTTLFGDECLHDDPRCVVLLRPDAER
jgi:hypothetical protein